MKPWVAPLLVAQWLVIRGAEAAVDCAPSTQSFTIKTSQDVSDISTCSTFTGNILVAADGPETIALDGITTITGNIDIENVASLRSLSSQSLNTVLSFTLNDLPELSNLSFPSLKNFTSIRWLNLPSLESTELASGTPESEIQEITIMNTTIKSLDWITYPVGGTLNVTSNTNLQSFSIPLSTINTGSTLTLANNPVLQTITVSQIGGIYGALQVSSNPKLEALDFKGLETIGGYVQLSGAFNNVSMPALNAINGALNVDSTGDISTLCNDLSSKSSSNVLNGHYNCNSNTQQNTASQTLSATATSTPTQSSTPASSNNGGGGLATGIKVAIISAAILVPVLALSLIGACIYFRKRMRSKVREIEKKQQKRISDLDTGGPSKPELSGEGVQIAKAPEELDSPDGALEMAHGKLAHELEADEGPKEMEALHRHSDANTPITPVTPMTPSSWWSNGSETALLRHELPA